ncbi:hypothetical protein KSP40_PGU021247 [Platanthera guangdongensis]|uniref:Dienelactone hydrolase domain-containing protein n=1 Tax=Platanthera guangdongensis TaxID=2320717 RepID=A0ABR2M3U7_9ASPA
MAATQLLLFRSLSPFSRRAVAASFLHTPTYSSLSATGAMASTAEPFLKVQIQRDDTTFDAYVVGKENAPGIVVVQEWWGVDFEVKNHAQKIANLAPGYRALIPDLYRGKVGLDVAEAQHLLDSLNWPAAVEDIRASAKWLKENGSPKVGVTGFCMGGALSIASAVLVPEVDAVVGFYGAPPAELADASKAKAPVQAHFGELDTFVGFSDVTRKAADSFDVDWHTVRERRQFQGDQRGSSAQSTKQVDELLRPKDAESSSLVAEVCGTIGRQMCR